MHEGTVGGSRRETLKRAEGEMICTRVSAARLMREAAANLDNQGAWESWQYAEEMAERARQRWWELMRADEEYRAG